MKMADQLTGREIVIGGNAGHENQDVKLQDLNM